MWQLFLAMTLAALTGCSHTAPTPNTRTDKGSPAPAPAASRPVRPIAERPPFKDVLEAAAEKPSAPFEGEGWTSLFDGKTLNGWKPTDFAGHGDVECQLGMIIFEMGDPFTGLNWTGSVPRMNYEVALDAMRVNGSDFFCGLTVPVNDTACSLIVGGWGGSLIGISTMPGRGSDPAREKRIAGHCARPGR